ncbi:MAG: DUF305 domain-containing protein [Sphingobacteriales bacterium]|nr:MAG: DUF305 domain-containing protein [Sphingobacteriales bacterium]
MKIAATILTAVSMFFISSCGDSSDNTVTNTDTLTSKSNSPTAQTLPPPDTTKSTADLMKQMNDMMDKMHTMQVTGDFDVDFANIMIEHHQSALDMAQVELSQGKDEKMKAKAKDIITKQQKEQLELKDFVQNYEASGMKHAEGELQKSMQTMMDNMKSMQMSGNVDKDFATMMISHHEDGISMAKLEVRNGMADKLRQMAKKGIADQQKDISELKSFLASNK